MAILKSMNIHSLDERRVKRRHEINAFISVKDKIRNVVIGQVANLHEEGLMLAGQALATNATYQLQLQLPYTIHSQQEIDLGVECLWQQAMSKDVDLYFSGCIIISKSELTSVCIESLIRRQTNQTTGIRYPGSEAQP